MRLALALFILAAAGCTYVYVQDNEVTIQACCIDPKIPETCAKYLWERDGATVKRAGDCPKF
jgi:hypothetical protein